MERSRRRLAVPVAVGVAGAYAWWATGLQPFTWPALVAVGVAGIVTIILGSRRRRPPFQLPAGAASGALLWGIVFALLVGWELAAYVHQPCADHPTLSALADGVIDGRPARALAFLAWIALGADLFRR